MIKRFISRFGLIGAIFLITVMVFSVSVNAADISADMIHKSPMGSFKGKMFLKGDNLRQEMNIGGENFGLIKIPIIKLNIRNALTYGITIYF